MARLHVVTGKGGVGKSTVAAAIAIGAAARGQRVLAIELGEPAGLCRILGARPREPGAIASAAGGTHVAFFDGTAALAEYLTRKVRLGRFARAILQHPLYIAFVDAAPGLGELMAIGKVRDELVLQARWDVVVVDAGASGHALGYLRMPAVAAATFARGRVHREAEVNAALLRDRAQTAIHVVATAEEMPLREAVETLARLRELDVALGRVVVNRCVPPAPAEVDALLATIEQPVVAQLLGRARAWEQIQERGIAWIEPQLVAPVVRLPRVPHVDPFVQAHSLVPALAVLA